MKPNTAILTAACAAAAFVPLTTTSAAAQLTDAATAVATVTVESTPITVSGGGILSFGTHFAAAGIVENQGGDVEWLIDGPVGATVELSFTQLPGVLEDGVGNSLPVQYGSTSMSVWCDDGAGNVTAVNTRPEFGAVCLLDQNGSGLVELGNGLGGSPGRVSVDLTGAPDGTYTGTIELTAIIR